MNDADSQQPLLPTLRSDPRLDQELRRSLSVLRDRADRDLASRIDEVLDGRRSLRDLARTELFNDFVEPLAAQGWREWDEMDPDDREQLTRRAVEDLTT